MATLTQGTLLKLLQSTSTPSSRTSRKHRLSLLQVIGIVPALDASDSLWPNHGFLVQLSDSLNSTYVSLSDQDTDLILTNSLQLGQFAHIDRFLFAFPVPRVSSIRPIPGRHAFLGTPQPLIVRVSAKNRDFVIQSVSDSDFAKFAHQIAPYFSKKFEEPKVKSRQTLTRREDMYLNSKEIGKNSPDSVVSNQSDASLDTISLGNSRESVNSDPHAPSLLNLKRLQSRGVKVNSMQVIASRENISLNSTDLGLSRDSIDSNKLPVIPDTNNLRNSHQSCEMRKIDEPKDVVRTRQVLAAKENINLDVTNLGNSRETVKSDKPRRFSSPSVTRIQRSSSTGRKGVGTIQRDSSPAGKEKRSASPVPSKCEVPSLIAARVENRTISKAASIVVPSRYRQPSPNGRTVRRASVSPKRRMSGIFKGSPMIGDSAGRKKMPSIVVGISKGSDALVGSGKTSRKSWDDGSVGVATGGESKEKVVSKNKLDLQGILRTQAAMSTRLSDINIVQPKHNDAKTNSKIKPIFSDTVLGPEKLATFISGIMFHDKKWTDGIVSLDAVSTDLARLGKMAMQRRVFASEVAAEALEEAVSMESIVRSLSKFSEICSMSESEKNLSSVIDGFLSLYEHVADSIDAAPHYDDYNISTFGSKSVTWVEAALATDLGVASMFDQNLPRTSSKKQQSLDKESCPKLPKTEWTKAHEVDAIDVARKLKSEMQMWFLRFVESSDSNLHRVLQSLGVEQLGEWLDLMASERHELGEKIGSLKQKIYGLVN